MSPVTETLDDTIIANLNGALTPEGAEAILSLGFSEEQQERMQLLADKARSGDLSASEENEADSYERVSSMLGILQSKARMALRNTTA